ncbi:17694_t:CDS:2 [Funneliformis caledonium]|uniref:17694_t:CDS:1 n=1 Tax=Funneliformis caledonium TaxID=1117310 RepID=A0A9N9GA93_9GLOM|nr:17694_t:CDS:2 [Funneliformis caledonium]
MKLEDQLLKAQKLVIEIHLSQILFEKLKKIFELKKYSFLVFEINVNILVASNLTLKDINLNNKNW